MLPHSQVLPPAIFLTKLAKNARLVRFFLILFFRMMLIAHRLNLRAYRLSDGFRT